VLNAMSVCCTSSVATAAGFGNSAVASCRFFNVVWVSGHRAFLKIKFVKHSLGFQKRSGASSLHQTGRDRHSFAGRFEECIELPQRDRALLARPG